MVTRAYNKIENVSFGCIKKSSKTQRLADEISYYRDIQSDTNKSIFFPRLIRSHLESDNNWMILEKYGYKDLGKLLVYSKADWETIVDLLFDTIQQFQQFRDTELGNPFYSLTMFVEKTEREYNAFVKNHPELLDVLLCPPVLVINSIEYANFLEVWNPIREYIHKHMLNYDATMIHGDMCLSNILYHNGCMKFIDPRGSYGKRGIYGDSRYDVAKLYHSFDGGYEFLIEGQYDLSMTDKGYDLMTRNWLSSEKSLEIFENKFFPYYSKREIKIIQGTIFIGMCDRHYDDRNRQIAMYLTGVRLLNEALLL